MVLLICLALITSIGISVLSSSLSVGISLFLFMIFGNQLSHYFSARNRKETRDLLLVFYSVYTVYILFSIVAYLDFLQLGDFFLFPDQNDYYRVGSVLGESNSITQIFYECFVQRIHYEGEGAYFFFGTIAYVANNYFDGNSILLQSLHVSFLAIIINIFVYKILVFHTSRDKAFKSSLIFAFFSPLFFYSPWILRDIHITLLYAIGIYLMHTRFSIKRLLLYIPLIVITLEFRLESGVFFLVLPLFYLYFRGRKYRYFRELFTGLLVVGLIFIGVIINFLSSSLESTLASFQSYSSYTEDNLGDGLGALLYKLPVGLKQLAITLFSQISPFPPWGKFLESTTIYEMVISLVRFCGAVYWSCIFLFLCLSLTMKDIRNRINKENLALFLILFTFLLGNSSEMNIRRILCVYPLIFILYVNIKEMIEMKKRVFISNMAIMIYSLLAVTYFAIKYL